MTDAPRPPLNRGHWLILGFWFLLSLVFTVLSVLDSRADTGWEDLIAFVVILLFVFVVAALVVSWAIARYLMSDAIARGVVLVLGPPVLVVLVVLLLRALS